MRAKRSLLSLFLPILPLLGALGCSQLIVPTNRMGSLGIEPHPTVIRQRQVIVDLRLLQNKRIRLPLFDGAEVVLVRDEEESGPRDAFVWEGEVEGQPGSMAILANVEEVLVGDVMTRDRTGAFAFYQIRYLGDGVHVLKEVDQSKFPAEEGERPSLGPSRPVSRRPRSASLDFLLAAAPSDRAARSEGDPASAAGGLPPVPPGESNAPVPVPTQTVCADPASHIDALVVYTDAARDAVGNQNAMMALIKAAVHSTNWSYGKSNVTQRLRLVHVQRVEYQERQDSLLDREQLVDGHVDGVRELRDSYAADVVVLIVDERGDCGWSKVMPTVSPQNESEAYAVVPHDCAAGPKWSFAHELGHIMGARHNWEDDPTKDAPFPYNHGLVSPESRSPWHTIMAKALDRCGEGTVKCTTRIPRWSNPGVSYPGASGDPTGITDTVDNHQALEKTADTVANFRCKSP